MKLSEKIVLKILNKQFEIAGLDTTFEKIPDDGIVEVGGKRVEWYKHYKFKTKEQYEQWRSWAESILKKETEDWEEELRFIDMRYGLTYGYSQKEGA